MGRNNNSSHQKKKNNNNNVNLAEKFQESTEIKADQKHTTDIQTDPA
jgi:hypothetical protein